MKFIARILAVLFVFAFPVSVNAQSLWKYGTKTDAMTDQTQSTATIQATTQSSYIELFGAPAGVPSMRLIARCDYSRELYVEVRFIPKIGDPGYEAEIWFDITTRFDKQPAYDMSWWAQGDHDFAINGSGDHEGKFIKSLRKNKILRLRPEQQDRVYILVLRGEVGGKVFNSIEPLDHVLRDCGRDDLID